VDKIVAALRQFEERFGKRFRPHAGWANFS
jgi:hypothetical protein